MNKIILLLAMLMLWASPTAAQQTGEAQPTPIEQQAPEALEAFDAHIGADYRSMSLDRGTRAGEYEYLKSGGGGILDLEWDPLPHRLVVESTFLNQKDYFGEMDYAYRDVVVLNLFTRGVFHNLDHYHFGTDNTSTASPAINDRNPDDVYGIGTQISRAFIRFKMPDYPLHLFVDARTVDREGTIQQRFMRAYVGGLTRASQARDIDWNSQDVMVGINSHIGPIEAEFSHSEKKFKSIDDKVLYDAYTTPAMQVPHNQVSEVKSSTDSVKVHTAMTGRVVASGTYSTGEKKNEDSLTKVSFHNTAGDITLTPVIGTLLVLKYRHYDIGQSVPETVTVSAPASAYNIRQALSSKRDVMTGSFRYRMTLRLTLRGDYTFDTTLREAWHADALTPLQISPVASGSTPDYWNVATRTTKGTARLGAAYRVMNKLTLRADYSSTKVTSPAYAMDPDRVETARASITYSPIQKVTALASYGSVREKRDNLSAPLAGGNRKADRNQGLGSLTFQVGRGTSLTTSYYYYGNKNKETITYRDAAGLYAMEDSVPYSDKAEIVSVSASQAFADAVQLTVEASRGYSRGNFRTDGSVANTDGIAELSDMKVVENTYSGWLDLKLGRNLNTELRYQQWHYVDKIDAGQSGTVNKMMATVSMKW